LAAARKAAQSSAQPQKGQRTSETGEKPALRGPNRIVLWSAAGALAAALASGAVVLKSRMEHVSAPEPAPVPEPEHGATAASVDVAPPAEHALIETPTIVDPHAAQIDESSIAAAAAKAKSQAQQKAAAPTPKAASHEKVAAASPAPTVRAGVNAQAVLSEAAGKGDAVAQYDLALRRIAAGQKAEGVALLRRAANQGLAMAQYRLAKLYERGEGVTPDINQAREWTERAAAAGNRKAMHDLGVYYARGEGANLDEGTAFRWFKQAAELGVADSQYNLGVLYLQGRGVSANPGEALFWFTIAARSGDGDARARAATLEAQIGDEKAHAIRQRADNFQARPSSARANGDFGDRIWSEGATRPS
jgi:localization factor PodJL